LLEEIGPDGFWFTKAAGNLAGELRDVCGAHPADHFVQGRLRFIG
jgi:hypothetical protein